ncbi:MAG: hypothetical protein LBQ92_02370, partial [Propionibacteriaceae bacterium]|nr:hypothetical protein [Propionibacteriaceae bacterium]
MSKAKKFIGCAAVLLLLAGCALRMPVSGEPPTAEPQPHAVVSETASGEGNPPLSETDAAQEIPSSDAELAPLPSEITVDPNPAQSAPAPADSEAAPSAVAEASASAEPSESAQAAAPANPSPPLGTVDCKKAKCIALTIDDGPVA